MPLRAFGNASISSRWIILHTSHLHQNEILARRGVLAKNLLLAYRTILVSNNSNLLVICAPDVLDLFVVDLENLYEGSVLSSSLDHNSLFVRILLRDCLVFSDDCAEKIFG